MSDEQFLLSSATLHVVALEKDHKTSIMKSTKHRSSKTITRKSWQLVRMQNVHRW